MKYGIVNVVITGRSIGHFQQRMDGHRLQFMLIYKNDQHWREFTGYLFEATPRQFCKPRLFAMSFPVILSLFLQIGNHRESGDIYFLWAFMLICVSSVVQGSPLQIKLKLYSF